MTNRISHIFILSLAAWLGGSATGFAKSQFLPESTSDWGNYHTADIKLNSEYNNCLKAGYTIKSCPPGYALDIRERCPFLLNSSLYKKCYSLAELCQDKGYQLSCADGYEPNLNQYCPYDSIYIKCQCAQCVGYDYTLEEANSDGYIADGDPCLSCSTPKYKRKINPCNGYEWDEKSCGATSCGKLNGEYCKSGDIYKYKNCNSCTVPSCPDGKVNYNTFWCGDALKCWWPESGSQQCKQTGCFDYPYSASVTCQPGFVKKSCDDRCVGLRYKCDSATGCDEYGLSTESGCEDGYESCTDSSGLKHYKCRICTSCEGFPLKEQKGCSFGYEECSDSCGISRYKCKDCTPKSCEGYTLHQQSGCVYGYLSCNDGCGSTTYKCKPYAVGDSYYQNGLLLGKVIALNGSDVIVASPPKAVSEEVIAYCDAMTPGNWYAPNNVYAKKALSVYRSTLTKPDWSYFRISKGEYSNDYCVSISTTWSKSACSSPNYTLYNTCLIAAQNIL